MRELYTGDEAVARGAYEVGVSFASAYPGTPSTEILENIGQYHEITSEWAPNEKVALEAVIGAGISGVRSLAAMKHVGDVLCFLSQISWAFYSFAALKVMRHVSVGVTTLWAGFCGAIFTLVYGSAVGEFQVSVLPPLPLLSFAYMAILGGLLSIFFYNYAMNETGPSLASIFLNIMPVVGMFSGFLVLSESIDVVQIAGALTIFIGVYWTTHGDFIANRLLHRT